ncbi:hypothetical protein C1N81_04345 (plasmid) [Streptomyces sp. SGAir0957]
MLLLGRARLRTGLLLAAIAATVLTALGSLPAAADPTPTPSTSQSEDSDTGAAPGPGEMPQFGAEQPTKEEIEQVQELVREQSQKFGAAAQQEALDEIAEQTRKLLPNEGGILSVFNVTDANNLPISVYSVHSDTGGLTDWDLGVMNLVTELTFMIVKWLIAFCCWLIGWALSFGLAKILLAPALTIADSIHAKVIMEMGLPGVFLSACALICVTRIFFGDRARGFGDAAVTIVLAGLTATVLASPPQTLLGTDEGAVAIARGLALQVSGAILDADPATTWQSDGRAADEQQLSRPMTDALTDAFIVKPAMLLQYGRVFKGECAEKYGDTRLRQLAFDRRVQDYADRANKLRDIALPLSVAPTRWVADWGTDQAVKYGANRFGGPPMEAFEKDCVHGDVASAKKASLDKVGGAIFLLIATLIVTVLVSALAGSFLTAQCRIAWDAIRGEPALLAGTVPGAGRGYLWDWGGSILHSLAQMMWSITALSVFIVILDVVLDPTFTDWGQELTIRFLAIDVLCIAAVTKRKKINNRTRQIGDSFRSKMYGARIGGTHGSIFTPPASTPAAKDPQIARKTMRALVRTAMVGTALASGNVATAAAYALPQGMGVVSLANRLSGPKSRTGTARPSPPAARAGLRPPAGGGNQRPGTPPGPRPGGTPGPGSTPNPGGTPGPGAAPRPRPRPGGPRPSPAPANVPGTRSPAPRVPSPATAPVRPRHQPRHPMPTQPAASPRQQQLRQRLDRTQRRPGGGSR